jgi:hypothetical protein
MAKKGSIKKKVPLVAVPAAAASAKAKKPASLRRKSPVTKQIISKVAANDNEQLIESSKYFVSGAAPAIEAPKVSTERPYIPYNYGKTAIILMVRDPHWLFTYWEITEEKYNEARRLLGNSINSSKEILRVYNTSHSPWTSFDITIFSGARNWYINAPEAGCSYLVEIGYLSPDGTFIVLARSNMVKTPLDHMSDVIDEEWMTIDFERIYALSGGFGIGKSSGEIKKLMERYLKLQSSSGWISSVSSPFGGLPERPFFLVANTELIVYGATEPTAKLFVQGKRIPLRKDGTFSMRFALPNGIQEIPIEAIRDDDKEKRKITKTVEKKTS